MNVGELKVGDVVRVESSKGTEWTAEVTVITGKRKIPRFAILTGPTVGTERYFPDDWIKEVIS